MRPGAAALPPAERLLRGLGVTEARDIDLDLVAWERRAEVVYRPLKGAEAHIQGRGGTAVIIVNSLSPPERRRYSLAHELGHWHHHTIAGGGCSPAAGRRPRRGTGARRTRSARRTSTPPIC